MLCSGCILLLVSVSIDLQHCGNLVLVYSNFMNKCAEFVNIHTLTHPFNGPLSGTTRVSQYQKGKTNLDFTEARDSEWQWH